MDVAFAQVPNEKLETSGAASGNGSTWVPWMWMDGWIDGLIGSNDSGALLNADLVDTVDGRNPKQPPGMVKTL